MARISLVICDLCKDEMSGEGDQFAVALTLYPDGGTSDAPLCGEICKTCYLSLVYRIKADIKAKLSAPKKAQEKRATRAASTSQSSVEAPYALPEKAVGPSEEEKADREPTKELLDDEMTMVKSRFDRVAANKTVSKQKGPCEHHFKSFRGGKVICGAAPDGYKGDFASFKGCGNILTAAEY